jgi:hypothetical protein
MWTDPVVDETRRIRDEHAKKFNYDLRAIFEDIKLFEDSLNKQIFTSNVPSTLKGSNVLKSESSSRRQEEQPVR